MEQNVQAVAKKLWHIVRVAFFIVRKNMNKRKLLLDLKYLVMKRPKLAGKSFTGKITHHHNHHPDLGGAYEFSCSDTPNHPNYIFPFQFKRAHNHAPIIKEEIDELELHAVNKVLEMMLTSEDVDGSPLPGFGFGFGRRPVVRVTDSPYPLHDVVEVGNYKVDEAAEEFIQRFYDQLKQQWMTNV